MKKKITLSFVLFFVFITTVHSQTFFVANTASVVLNVARSIKAIVDICNTLDCSFMNSFKKKNKELLLDDPKFSKYLLTSCLVKANENVKIDYDYEVKYSEPEWNKYEEYFGLNIHYTKALDVNLSAVTQSIKGVVFYKKDFFKTSCKIKSADNGKVESVVLE